MSARYFDRKREDEVPMVACATLPVSIEIQRLWFRKPIPADERRTLTVRVGDDNVYRRGSVRQRQQEHGVIENIRSEDDATECHRCAGCEPGAGYPHIGPAANNASCFPTAPASRPRLRSSSARRATRASLIRHAVAHHRRSADPVNGPRVGPHRATDVALRRWADVTERVARDQRERPRCARRLGCDTRADLREIPSR